jgi:MoxR-like ATPase
LARIAQARRVVDEIYVDEKVKNYILDIVAATRNPQGRLERLKNLDPVWGVAPGHTGAPQSGPGVCLFARAGLCDPEDVKNIGPDVLRHRIILTYEAEAEEKTTDDVIQDIFNEVDVP